MIYLTDLPVDVLYHILSNMRLQDAWPLAVVCLTMLAEGDLILYQSQVSRTFRNLSTDRTFWMVALKTSPSIRSASNPLSTDDLSAMDLPALKQLALHSVRLERNWTLANPRILGEVRNWKLGDNSVLATNHLFQFPGSELFIFYSGKLLKCFDFTTGEYTTALNMDGYVRCASYDFLPEKSVLLGLALKGGARFDIPMLLFIKIGLNPRKTGVVATIVLQTTLARETDCQKPFVSLPIVGAVQSRGSEAEILAYDLSSGGSTIIETDIPINYIISRRLDFSFHHDNLYLIADDGPRAVLYCCPRNSLPYGSQLTTTSILTFGDIAPLLFPTKTWKRRVPVCSQMFRNASFVKVHDTMSTFDSARSIASAPDDVRLTSSSSSHFVTTFRFWTSSSLNTTPPRDITVTGMCWGEQTMNAGGTGCNVVAALFGMGQAGGRLVLVRFDPDFDSCSSHELELPDGVHVKPPLNHNILSVDDHRGVVWLVDGGDLWSIPYA
ncbi:hypothetical protein FB451DRAFT_1208744 [Mycena latifolia]|nr:hypothetical protein FB451DRAFT_1208744 [Mycena latifolia]